MLATAPHPVLVFIRQRNTTVFAEKCLHNFWRRPVFKTSKSNESTIDINVCLQA
jgi:hypothetical protein